MTSRHNPTAATADAQPAPAPPADTNPLDRLIARLDQLLDVLARPKLGDQLAVGLDVAAQLTNLSEKTLKRMIASGEVPGVIRLRRRVLISVAALTEWVARGCPPATGSGRSSRRRFAGNSDGAG